MIVRSINMQEDQRNKGLPCAIISFLLRTTTTSNRQVSHNLSRANARSLCNQCALEKIYDYCMICLYARERIALYHQIPFFIICYNDKEISLLTKMCYIVCQAIQDRYAINVFV
jgi:hypothetical protein